MNRKLRMLFFAGLCGLSTSATSLMACRNCKSAFESTTSQASVGEAYSWTIYLLILLPIALVATITMKIARGARQHAARQAA